MPLINQQSSISSRLRGDTAGNRDFLECEESRLFLRPLDPCLSAQVFHSSQLGSLELRVFVETAKGLGSKENIDTLAQLPRRKLSVISV